MNVKLHIPNLLTTGNLLCGVFGIQQAYYGNLLFASYLIGAAVLFDFLDGFVARLLKVSSPLGKQLDSLADLVSFGVLPGVMAFQLTAIAVADVGGESMLKYVAYCIPAFSAYRLAKFNIDERQSSSFIGLPTPANALFWASIPVIASGLFGGFFNIDTSGDFLTGIFLSNSYTVPLIALGFSLLLVAELPLFALKFSHFNWSGNELKYSMLIIALGLFMILGFAAVPSTILLYIILSLFNNASSKSNNIE